MNITDYIEKKSGLKRQPELTDTPARGYSMFTTGGVECEVGEFLYGLVRMLKPDAILETGTGDGISAAYMGLALKHNGEGTLHTIEQFDFLREKAEKLFEALEIANHIALWAGKVEDFVPSETIKYQLIFLDTEPQFRFAELLKFWNNLADGGLVIIHDLHPGMGQTARVLEGMLNFPFGTVPEGIVQLIRDGELQSFHFQSPRGLYIGQKRGKDFYSNEILASRKV